MRFAPSLDLSGKKGTAVTTRATSIESRLREVGRAGLEADALERSGLDQETYHLVRIAALAALGGCMVSWVNQLEAADEANIDLDRVLGTILAVAPLIGAPRVLAADAQIVRASGLADVDHVIPSA